MKTPKWPDPKNSNIIELGLDRVYNALEKLGNPHLQLPPVIHVAGTNGKGSTMAFLRAMLEAAGKTCHVYTSPHLVEFNERIVLAGKEISDDFLNDLIGQTEKKCTGINLTFFEGTTIAAFLAFSKVRADYLLLETGMGGRLDATNVAPAPLITIITPVSFDHMEFLGDSIEKIAFEKACIIKECVPCIVAPQPEAALKKIKEQAKEKNAKLIIADRIPEIPVPSLAGEHQYINAATARLAAIELGLSEENINAGIVSAEWKARMQKLSDNVYLDGGHNPEAARTIHDFVKTRKDRSKSIAIVGMIKTKDFHSFIKNLSPAFDEIIAVPVPDNIYREPAEIKEFCGQINVKCTISASVENALAAAKKQNALIVICGSLYLAGQVLEKELK